MNGGRGVPIIHRWSTEDIGAKGALDYYAAATSAALIPVSVQCERWALFNASVERAEFGPLDILRLRGTTHSVHRGAREIARSSARHFYVMLNVSSKWSVKHRGNLLLGPGEAVFLDSDQPYELILDDYELVTLDMPERWVRRWVRNPEHLAGRNLSLSRAPGRALASMLPCLTPKLAVDPALAVSEITDHIGSLLALAETDFTGEFHPFDHASIHYYARIREAMLARCGERGLDARTVGAALDIPIRFVDDAIAMRGESFTTMLTGLRATVAVRMMNSRTCSWLPVAEVARCSGFPDVVAMVDAMLAHPSKVT